MTPEPQAEWDEAVALAKRDWGVLKLHGKTVIAVEAERVALRAALEAARMALEKIEVLAVDGEVSEALNFEIGQKCRAALAQITVATGTGDG